MFFVVGDFRQGHQEPPTATAAAGPAPIADASEAWRPDRRRAPPGDLCPQKPAATAGGRDLCLAAFRTPAVRACGQLRYSGVRKPAQLRKSRCLPCTPEI